MEGTHSVTSIAAAMLGPLPGQHHGAGRCGHCHSGGCRCGPFHPVGPAAFARGSDLDQPGHLVGAAHSGDKTAEQRVNSLVEAGKGHNEMADTIAHLRFC